MSLHKRNPSHISIYDYPEHLNPFYEDDNHKRLRFWKFSKKKNDNGKHSLSIGNLQELWKSYSFRKKKSSTLGINKTSESPPTLRRDLNDKIFRGDRHTSLQNIDTRRESDSNGMFFHRNVGYRSTTQFSGYSVPHNQNIRSSQSSLSTNPFESDAGSSCPSSPMSTRKQYRKKRRAPPPPKRSTIPDYLATKDIESLASEIEEFVNNRNESTINPEVEKEVVVEKLSVTVPVSDIEPNPSTSKAPQQSNDSAIRTGTEQEKVSVVTVTRMSTTPPPPPCIASVHVRQSLESDLERQPLPPVPIPPEPQMSANPSNPSTSTTLSPHPQCIASVHVKQTLESKTPSTDRKPNDSKETNHIERHSVSILDSNIQKESLVTNGTAKEASMPNQTRTVNRTLTVVESKKQVDSNKPCNEVFQPEEHVQNGDESIQERKTNSFGTVKQISQIFEENISSSSNLIKEKENPKASSPKPENLDISNAGPPSSSSAASEVLQIREDFELESPAGVSSRYIHNGSRDTALAEWEREAAMPTPRMRKKKSIKEVLESISRNQKILNESAAKGTKVYLTPSYAENRYNYPNELNNVNLRSSKEVTSANISVSSAPEANEQQPTSRQNNLFISKINKVKGPYRESSPTSSNLDWNPVPKPNRAHQHSPNSNFNNNGSC
ncbi:LOW QUALITY PROTEIN: muscle M-line assembly protein unc-89 [Drosophila serrata]|uniref:LOW QUALITY PROTEIN: muscle M-line assembly protein unc-89 n=1 Tax=Drosophila serrata TaxID=7274 RepID=UPI000A1D2B24|nr:LOW QUALITY PROTEIN: muscle M-line assembly protein unc-89 [Drosophila serrata]